MRMATSSISPEGDKDIAEMNGGGGGEVSRERSAGIIPFRYLSGKREYVLLQHVNGGHWGFPKGHIEGGEAPIDAAVRELREETSLNVLQICRGFREKIEYSYSSEELEEIRKEVVFFLGRVSAGKPRISAEHLACRTVPYEEALELITYENSSKLLQRGELFLLRKGSD